MLYYTHMIITHHGKQFFKLQTGDRVIALNPIAKDSKFKTSGFLPALKIASSGGYKYCFE